MVIYYSLCLDIIQENIMSEQIIAENKVWYTVTGHKNLKEAKITALN
jgi:hypothetical protein